MKGYMYILLCNDGSYYTGSTNDLERRMEEHFSGQGSNHTKKHPPVKLLYYEEFQRIDEAFYREKQVQGWSRKKKEALINGQYEKLPELAKCYAQRDVASTSSATKVKVVEPVETTDDHSSATKDASSTTNEAVPEPVEGTATKPVEGTDTAKEYIMNNL
ncbi:MAG: GIY-YIG nuclease family protein [Salinivirgaceae bacterium]|nr:GIY-YIG nuclease family protein [Salinivirgaceae bacterium]